LSWRAEQNYHFILEHHLTVLVSFIVNCISMLLLSQKKVSSGNMRRNQTATTITIIKGHLFALIPKIKIVWFWPFFLRFVIIFINIFFVIPQSCGFVAGSGVEVFRFTWQWSRFGWRSEPVGHFFLGEEELVWKFYSYQHCIFF
jgi:hypothetical protein